MGASRAKWLTRVVPPAKACVVRNGIPVDAFGASPDLAATDFGCLGFAVTLPQDFGFGFFEGLWVIFGMIVYT